MPLWAAPDEGQRRPDRLVFGAGYFDVIKQEQTALDLRFEYRWGWRFWVLRPWAGIEWTNDGALYGVAGFFGDVELGSRWIFTPAAGAGFYEEGSGKNLGQTVEFRTQIEFARRFRNDTRLAVALSHISNAGLSRLNPGTDILTVYYSIPLDR